MLYTIRSHRPIEEIRRRLPEAAGAHAFGVLDVHDLRRKMQDKGVTFERDCLVFEVCNPRRAKEVLDENMAIATALPCRIAVWTEGAETVLATMLPTALIEFFGGGSLVSVAEAVERDVKAIMDEAAAP